MSGPLVYLGVAVGGSAGAAGRFLLDRFVQARVGGHFPFGTLSVNVTGSALVGFLVGLGIHAGLSEGARTVLAGGFCGGFTTFSTFAVEAGQLAGGPRPIRAVAYVALATTAALVAAAAGLGLAAVL